MINPNTQTINETSRGVAVDSNVLKEKMIRAAEKCGNGLLHYYSISGNVAQENKLRYMLKDLLFLKNEEAEYICETIYEEANTHLVAAMKHGYTAEDLAQLRNCLDGYRSLITGKRQRMTNKKNLDEVMESFRLLGKRTV